MTYSEDEDFGAADERDVDGEEEFESEDFELGEDEYEQEDEDEEPGNRMR